MGDVFDQLPEPGQSCRDQNQSREQRGDEQSIIAVQGDHVKNDHDECAFRPAHLNTRAPEAEIRKPATTAVTSPLSGDAPLAIARAIDSGKGCCQKDCTVSCLG